MQGISADVTVVVGRFQVPELHYAHKELLRTAINNARKMCIILVGYNDNNFTNKDPLPFEVREAMIESWISTQEFEHKPSIIIGHIKDIPFSNKLWSESLDGIIDGYISYSTLQGSKKVLLLGGRDSFLKYYDGSYLSCELPEVSNISGTVDRIKYPKPNTKEESYWFRTGMIAAQVDKPYGNIYPTVDGIVWRKLKNSPLEILLGRKHGELTWRMPGGHVNIEDRSLEEAVMREIHEECGLIELGVPEYFMSSPLNDRRYVGTKDIVYTTVFRIQCLFGIPEAGDDLEVVQWFPVSDIRDGKLSLLKNHKEILESYAEK